MRTLLSRNDRAARVGFELAGALVLFGLLVLGGALYASGGPPTRDILVTQMLTNAIIVLGMQLYIGNTGILSFGHIGFGALAGYTFAILAVTPERKLRMIPDAPFDLVDAHLHPFWAAAVAVGLALLVGVVVGLGLARSGARSGAVAATVITLALLFGVHEVANSWTELTAGRNGISFQVGESLDGNGWILIVLLVATVTTRLFKGSNVGRLAQAAREDDLAARAMGIDPARQQLIALLVSVALVAVGSSLRVYQLGTVTPNTFFFDFTLLTLVMLIVGGRNSVAGALLGVGVITAGNELTRYLAGPDVNIASLDWILRDGLSDIFLGGAMLGFMILRPKGLIDDWELDEWFRRRFGAPEPTPDPAAPAPPERTASLAVQGVSVTFGGFQALVDADVTAQQDEIVGLIGPNGAGKTTLLNVITGLVTPTAGTYSLGQSSLVGKSPSHIARAGLARTFQNLRLFPSLTVRENVEVVALVAARHRSHRTLPATDQLLAKAGIWEQRNRRAGELDYGSARRLELARAAALAPDFLLLDEPTSGMSDSESLEMIEHVRGMAAVVGAGVVVIDHDLGFITGICDRIACLDQGQIISTGTPAEIQADPLVQAAYLGTSAAT